MTDTPKRADRQEIARRVERGEKLLQKGKPAEALEELAGLARRAQTSGLGLYCWWVL